MPPGPAGWRLILGTGAGLDPEDGVTNMAMDTALLESVAAGAAPVLRLYRWAPACLSFGRNQPARGLYDLDGAARDGVDLVRRVTGGQAVLHDDELTYCVVAPVAVIGGPRDAYRRINGALVTGLRALGVGAGLAAAPGAGGGLDWRAACFRRPAAGEVVAGGRKLVGSAQRMEARVVLQHGSILLGGSQARTERLLRDGRESARHDAGGGAVGWTTLDAELGERPAWDTLVAALITAFEGALGTRLAPGTPRASETECAGCQRERFASPAWTWRR